MANRNQSLKSLRKQNRHLLPERKDDPNALEWSFLYATDRVCFAQDALGFTPDPWQAAVLKHNGRRMILCCARQTGKSDTVAVLALHTALYKPGAMILIVSPSERQSIEVLHKINQHREKLRLQAKPLEDNKMSLELDNGSRIVSLPATEKTIRGFSAVDLLIEDEAGDVPDALHEAIEPMLQVSRGRIVLMGTPKGPRGHFAEIWRNGKDIAEAPDGWLKIKSTAWDNPRIPNEELRALKEEKTRLGRLFWFQQEYECEFLASGQGLVYPYESHRNASPHLPMHRKFGWQYALGIDYGVVDSTAFVVLGWRPDDPTLYVVESFKKKGLLPADAADIAKALTLKYPFARMVGDAGGLGKPYVEEARRRLRLPIEAAEKNNKRGFIELFVGELKSGMIKVMPGNEDLLAEWQLLPWDEERQLPADGYDDHLADACLYAWRCCYAYLETVRKVAPKRGTPEFDKAEQQAMFERRLAEVIPDQERPWWDAPQAKIEDTQADFWS